MSTEDLKNISDTKLVELFQATKVSSALRFIYYKEIVHRGLEGLLPDEKRLGLKLVPGEIPILSMKNGILLYGHATSFGEMLYWFVSLMLMCSPAYNIYMVLPVAIVGFVLFVLPYLLAKVLIITNKNLYVAIYFCMIPIHMRIISFESKSVFSDTFIFMSSLESESRFNWIFSTTVFCNESEQQIAHVGMTLKKTKELFNVMAYMVTKNGSSFYKIPLYYNINPFFPGMSGKPHFYQRFPENESPRLDDFLLKSRGSLHHLGRKYFGLTNLERLAQYLEKAEKVPSLKSMEQKGLISNLNVFTITACAESEAALIILPTYKNCMLHARPFFHNGYIILTNLRMLFIDRYGQVLNEAYLTRNTINIHIFLTGIQFFFPSDVVRPIGYFSYSFVPVTDVVRLFTDSKINGWDFPLNQLKE